MSYLRTTHSCAYDQRGNGLSDREVDDISFAAWVGDLETVVDAAGADRFALMGVSQSCKVAIAYAVRNPHRVSHLVLYGGAAGGTARQGPEAVERENAVQTLLRLGWGTETHPFSETIARRLMADGRPDQIRWWTDLQRITASSETAVRIRQMHSIADVVDLLPQGCCAYARHSPAGRYGCSLRGRPSNGRGYPGRSVRCARRAQSHHHRKRG